MEAGGPQDPATRELEGEVDTRQAQQEGMEREAQLRAAYDRMAEVATRLADSASETEQSSAKWARGCRPYRFSPC